MPDDQSSFQNPIPAAVRRQIEAAEAMAREAGVRNVPDVAAGDNPSPPPPETAENTVELTPGFRQQTENQGSEPQPPSEVPSGPAPAQTEDWEQRYRSLQGRFDAEVRQSREMRGELNGLRAMVENLQRQPPPQPQGNMAPQQRYAQPPSHQIPQADIDAYGMELIEGTQRWAEARVAQRLQDYERRLMSLEGGQQQIHQMTAQQRCDWELDRAMPNWRDVNASDAFMAWLQEYDVFSGQQRLAMLRDAYGAGDANRTLAFFRAFQREHTAVSPPLGISPNAPPAPGAGAQVPLAQLASPGRGAGSIREPGAQPAARVWREGEISRLSREYQRGLWNGREDEYNRRWEDAVAAGREGRYQTLQ